MCGVWGWATLETVPWEIQSTLRDKNMGEAWSQTTLNPKSLRRIGLHRSKFRRLWARRWRDDNETFSALIAALVQEGPRDLHNFLFFCLLTGQHYSFKTQEQTMISIENVTLLLFYLKDLFFFQLQKKYNVMTPFKLFSASNSLKRSGWKARRRSFLFFLLISGGKLGNPTFGSNTA